jgi:hypothetical protein
VNGLVADGGEQSKVQAAGTILEVMRDPKGHANALSEDEETWEKVDLLRGSEEDDGKHAAVDEHPAKFSNPARSKASPVQKKIESQNEHRAAKVHSHNSVVRDVSSVLYFSHHLQGIGRQRHHWCKSVREHRLIPSCCF